MDIFLFCFNSRSSITKKELSIPQKLKDKNVIYTMLTFFNNTFPNITLIENKLTKSIEKKDRKNTKQKQNGDTLDTQ